MDSFGIIHIEISSGRTDLDALQFLKQMLKRCRGRPITIVDRGLWYNWALDDLDLPCESRRETFGKRSLVEDWFGLLRYGTGLFYNRFPHYSSWRLIDLWVKAFAAFHNAIL